MGNFHMNWKVCNFKAMKLRGLWNTHQRSPINPILSRINSITHIFILKLSYLRAGLPGSLFPIGLPVKIWAICAAHLNLIDLISLASLGDCTNYKCNHCEWSFLHSQFATLLRGNIPKLYLTNFIIRNTIWSLYSPE